MLTLLTDIADSPLAQVMPAFPQHIGIVPRKESSQVTLTRSVGVQTLPTESAVIKVGD